MNKPNYRPHAHEPSDSSPPNRGSKPAQEIRVGSIKAAIWINQTAVGQRHNVTFTRIYRSGEDWRRSDNYGRDDLLVLAKVADLAHTWICEHPTVKEE
jgi:hypothetical protein